MTLYKTPHGYRYDFTRNGQRYTKSGFKTKKEASEAEAQRRLDVKKLKTISGTDFRSIAIEYLDLAQRKFVKNTYRQKAFVCKSFIEHIGNLPIEEITASHLHSYLNTRPSNNNYNAHRKDLCTIFSFALKVKRLSFHSPCWDLDKMPHTPEEKYIPPEKDILKLIQITDPETDERDLLLTLIHLVARIDEVLRLRWKDVNFKNRTVSKWTRKRKSGSYEAIIIHMNDDLHRLLENRRETREQDQWVFFNAQTQDRYYHRPKFMKGLCKRANIQPVFGFHNIRHFVASYLANSDNISKKAIGGLLGHKALQTTEIYLHTIDGSEREAIDRLTGKFN